MENKIKKAWHFRDYTILDLILLFAGIITITTTSIIFHSTWLIIVNSILGIICVFMQAKGKISTQFIGIVWFAFYCFLAYQNQYYGETILYAAIMIPLYIYGVIHWLKNRNKKDNVVIVRNNLPKKEWAVFIPSWLVVSVGVYFLLQALNTAELWLSTAAFCTMLPSVYLLIRRCKWNQMMFLINDIVLCALWQMLVFQGRLEFLTILSYQIFQIIYDAYGIYVWQKLAKKQAAENSAVTEENQTEHNKV